MKFTKTFQFHYGTIGSKELADIALVCFNSFNSTMVRLVEGSTMAKEAVIYKFQFHYGTIGSLELIKM